MLGRNERPGKKNTYRLIAGIAATVFAFGGIFLLASPAAHAALSAQQLGLGFGTATGLATQDIRIIAGNIVRAFLALLATIAVLLIIYAGFLWMTAQGKEDQIQRAKDVLKNATIGVIIIIMAYAIVTFIISLFGGAAGGGGGTTGGAESRYLTRGASGVLGSGLVEYVYPEDGQKDVVRNTKMAATFKKPLKRSTIFRNYFDNNTYKLDDDYWCNPKLPKPVDPASDSNCYRVCPIASDPVSCDQTCTGATIGTCQPTVYALNTDNVLIIKQDDMAETGTFDDIYAKSLKNVDNATAITVTASVTKTVSPTTLNPIERQTMVMRPADPLGSSSENVNYRVKVRGGDGGIKVWAKDDPTGARAAFPNPGPNDPFFWSFTTGTAMDLTPPQIAAVVPLTVPGGSIGAPDNILDRNQMLQIYFNEPVDPTLASGNTGAGGGFTNVLIEARCRSVNVPCDFECDRRDDAESCNAGAGKGCVWDTATSATPTCRSSCSALTTASACAANGKCQWFGTSNACGPNTPDADNYYVIQGSVKIGNLNRTTEFRPSKECEGVPLNSCGEKVYCLPKNVELRVTVSPADVGSNPPQASIDNGIEDMASNSLDGNRNTTAEGKSTGNSDKLYFDLNDPPASLAKVMDSVRWRHYVGENIDLTPPFITDMDPRSVGDVQASSGGGVIATTSYAVEKGPSKVPVDLPVVVTWSKVMSVISMGSGSLGEVVPPDDYTQPSATVTLAMQQCRKVANAGECPVDPTDTHRQGCPAGQVVEGTDPATQVKYYTCPVYLGFVPDAGLPAIVNGKLVTKMTIRHDPLMSSNDLGYTEADTAANPAAFKTPSFVPVIGAQMRDTKQNCFFPSEFRRTTPGQCDRTSDPSCCNLQDMSVPFPGDNTGCGL